MPPVVIVIGGLLFLKWLFSDDETTPPADALVTNTGNCEPPPGVAEAVAEEIPVSGFVTLEILREIFENGAVAYRRRDAVAILKGAPYYVPKTNAYRALAPSRSFAPWLREDEDGWLHFTP